MIHGRLKVLILSAAFLSLPGVRAFDWKPTGDFVGSDGFAYATGGTYNEGDRLISTAGGGETGETGVTMRSPRGIRSKMFKDGKRVMSLLQYRAGETGGGSVTPGGNTQFEATAQDGVLNIFGTLNGEEGGAACPLKLDGDVTLKAIQADMTVNIKSDVSMLPYIDPTGDAQGLGGNFPGTGHAQIQFEVAEGKKIEVNVDHNLEFKGRTLSGTNGGFEPMDTFLSFKGRGEVIFKMADGTAVKFSGDVDDTFKVDMLNQDPAKLSIDGLSNNAAGTKVLICMDQTKEDADKGLNKVTFRRKNLAQESLRNMIYVGANSGVFYVSDDVTGKAHVADPARGGFGSVAFDVSNQGTGRTVLFLQGARQFGWDVTDSHGNPLYSPTDPEFKKVAARHLFNDAAFVVAGHKVDSFNPAHLRTTLNYSIPAGSQAIMRVVDQAAYAAAPKPYAPAMTDVRGLLVINDTETVAKLAADNYWDFFNTSSGGEGETVMRSAKTRQCPCKKKRNKVATCMAIRGEEAGQVNVFGHDWSCSAGIADQTNLRNTRTGFVLGVNGNVDVYHGTAFDYVAGSANRVDDVALNDYQDVEHEGKSRAILAEHNPSAFVIDGLDSKLFATNLSSFEAANPALTADVAHARITLRGNGQFLMRASASQDTGYISKFWQMAMPGQEGMTALRKATHGRGIKKHLRAFRAGEEAPNPVINPIDINTIDFDAVLTVGESKFDGYKLEKIEGVTSWNGLNVLEVQGWGEIEGRANTSIMDAGVARQYATTENGTGLVNMLTLKVDHADNEVAARPLVLNNAYSRYNAPATYMNDVLVVNNVKFLHDDVTKLVDGLPQDSRPAIKGGERMFFSDQLWTFDGTHTDMRYRLPELRLHNGELALGESLNIAGARLVVTDKHNDVIGSNHSNIRFMDHGSDADAKFSGYGRLLVLGSYNNLMADGKSNWVTESAYINAFKQNDRATGNGQTSGAVKLNLTVGDQFPASVLPANYDKERCLHLILSSLMEKGGTNVAAGWTTIKGDKSGKSFPYGTSRYENSLLKETLSANEADLFVVDALKVPAADISFVKGFIGFGGFARDGKGATTPVNVGDAQGVVYANHGGRISAQDAQVVVDTMIVERVWNDYNFEGNQRVMQLTGDVALPHEQTTFTSNGGVQPFGLTKEMFAARAAETDGYVRLSYYNGATTPAERSGANEVVVNWFNTEGLKDVVANPTRSLASSVAAKKSAQSRAGAHTRSNPALALQDAIQRPASLLYVGSGDDIRQLRVAGATQTNPFMIEVSGDDVTRAYGRIREFATQPLKTDLNLPYLVDAGSHAVLFGVLGGRMGLGSTDWNEFSATNPWNILGKDFVQVAVEGDCVVDVNSNLIVADNQAIVAVNTFGAERVERVTFFSVDEKEIRIPAGVELDLSSFGKGAKRQEIAFGGRVKLVVEAGAAIRGPRSATGGVVLYFNDDAQLVFEAPSDRASGNKPYAGLDQLERVKMMGNFQIWLNKSAKMTVGDGMLVGVQSDESTPATNVVVSLNRQSRFDIGNEVTAGGAFEVGNPAPVAGGSVKFELASRHVDSIFHIDRQGFFGLGAGVMEKAGNINGSATADVNPVLADGKAQVNNGVPVFTPAANAWKVRPLYNVESVSINFLAGSFEHNNIADGSDANASLMAVGPAAAYNLRMSAPGQVVVKGGGNMMLVPATQTAGVLANVWDYATAFPEGIQYGIMASAPMLAQRDDVTRVVFNNSGFEYNMTDVAAYFDLLAAQNYADEKTKFASAGLVTSAPMRAAFVNLDASNRKYPANAKIVVRNDVNAIQGGSFDEALAVGFTVGIETNDLGPTSFVFQLDKQF